jgi:hypothetical protein
MIYKRYIYILIGGITTVYMKGVYSLNSNSFFSSSFSSFHAIMIKK